MSTAQRQADSWEWRRQRAWELHQQGWWQKEIAAAFGVSCAAVCQWIKRAQGVEALRTHPRPGPTPRQGAAATQARENPELLATMRLFGLDSNTEISRRTLCLVPN